MCPVFYERIEDKHTNTDTIQIHTDLISIECQ